MSTLRVHSVMEVAQGVRAFELTDPAGAALPGWQPGAHVEVTLSDGTLRQYSLCSDPADRMRYRIAVLRVDPPLGRGGSARIHEELGVGDLVQVGEPRNRFVLEPASRYLLLAGGIGITALLAMAHELERRGDDWRLIYGARSRAHVAFEDELKRLGKGRVTVVLGDEHGYIDIDRVLAEQPAAAIYTCGPVPMIAAVSAASQGRRLHVEQFTAGDPSDVSAGEQNHPFEVELARSGRRICVGAEQTILDALREAGLDPLCSCEQGI